MTDGPSTTTTQRARALTGGGIPAFSSRALLRDCLAAQIEPEGLARRHVVSVQPAEHMRLILGGVEDGLGRRPVQEVQADGVAAAQRVQAAAANSAARPSQRRLQPRDRVNREADQGGTALVSAAEQQARAKVAEADQAGLHGAAVGPGDVVLGGGDVAADVLGPRAAVEAEWQLRGVRSWDGGQRCQSLRGRQGGVSGARTAFAPRRQMATGQFLANELVSI